APDEPEPIFSGPVIDASMSADSVLGQNAAGSGRPELMPTVLYRWVCRPDSQALSHLFQVGRFSEQERNLA
ncbi:MAG: hypothetical protein ACYCRE_01370, partial [Acidobacteriaceae bacterium]